MRRLLPALAFAAAALGAITAPARADDAFDAFQQVCLAAHGDQAKALAAADQKGWQPMQPAMMAAIPPGQVDNPQGRMLVANNVAMMMFAGKVAKAALPGVDGNFCAVMTAPPDDGFVQAAAAMAAVPADAASQPGQNTYFWRDAGAAHTQVVRNGADARTLVASGPLTMLSAQTNAQMSLVAVSYMTAAQ